MKSINQIIAVTWLNILNIRQRAATSMVAVVGVAAVVLVFAAVLSMAKGFERTMLLAGAEDAAVVLRSGATSELTSGFGPDEVQIISLAPGVLQQGDIRVVSPELYVVVDVKKKSNNSDANVPFRGISELAFEVRDRTELIEGRMFETGKNELIVGAKAQEAFQGLEVGATIKFGRTDWQIVGVFSAGGGVAESELWTDTRVLQDAYRRGNSFQSVRLRLESPESIAALDAALSDDPRIDVDVQSERAYYAAQAAGTSTFIRVLGYPLTILMSIGAIFGALNSMYSSVSTRGKEIATLRALGFGPIAVLVSTMVESTVLALFGGAIGAVIAYVVFNGYTVSTLSNASFSQVVFDFAVTPDLLMQGLQTALIIGLIGGILPALRAARMPVATALREL